MTAGSHPPVGLSGIGTGPNVGLPYSGASQ